MKKEIIKIRSHLFASLFFVVSVGALHFIGAEYHLYYIIPWYDSVAHLLAGIGLGFFGIWSWRLALIYINEKRNNFKAMEFVWIFSMTLVVAVVWEVFELSHGITNISTITQMGLSYFGDTTKDISLAIIGAGISRFILPIGRR